MGRLLYGVHQQLEEAADELIRQSLLGVTSRQEKSDILTPWKESNRKAVEVYTTSGCPDPSLKQGIFRRARNTTHPHLNSNDGVGRSQRISRSETSVEHIFSEEE